MRLSLKYQTKKNFFYSSIIPIGIAIGIIVSIVFFYLFLNYKAIGYSELQELNITIRSYGMQDNRYIIKSHEYENDFLIHSVNMGKFDKYGFENYAAFSSNINIMITKVQYDKLKSNNKNLMIIYQIYTQENEYLSLENFNKTDKENAFFGLIFGFFMLFCAIGLLLLHLYLLSWSRKQAV